MRGRAARPPTAAQLADVQSRLAEVLGVDVWSSWTDVQRVMVIAEVAVATDDLRCLADDEFGPHLVELHGTLTAL